MFLRTNKISPMPQIKDTLLVHQAEKENFKVAITKHKVVETKSVERAVPKRNPLKSLTPNVVEKRVVKTKTETTYKKRVFLRPQREEANSPIYAPNSLILFRSKSTSTYEDKPVVKPTRPKSVGTTFEKKSPIEDKTTKSTNTTIECRLKEQNCDSNSSTLESESSTTVVVAPDENDEVFVDAEDFFKRFANSTKGEFTKVANGEAARAPIVPDKLPHVFPTVSDSVLENLYQTENLRRPARKSTLTRRRSGKVFRRSLALELVYDDPVIDYEYIEDIIKYMMDVEGSWAFRRGYLKKSVTSPMRRIYTINWMVYLQQNFNLQDSILYSAVRLFDRTVIATNLSAETYYLVAIVCIWIAGKVFDSQVITVSKIFALTDGRYTRQQITRMEREILTLIHFSLNKMVEPEIFIYYYMHFLKLHHNKLIRCSSLFILECFMLSLDFSSLHTSIVAAGALYLAMVTLRMDDEKFMGLVEDRLLSKEEFLAVVRLMGHFVLKVLNRTDMCADIIKKYSSESKLNVSHQVTPDLLSDF